MDVPTARNIGQQHHRPKLKTFRTETVVFISWEQGIAGAQCRQSPGSANTLSHSTLLQLGWPFSWKPGLSQRDSTVHAPKWLSTLSVHAGIVAGPCQKENKLNADGILVDVLHVLVLPFALRVVGHVGN